MNTLGTPFAFHFSIDRPSSAGGGRAREQRSVVGKHKMNKILHVARLAPKIYELTVILRFAREEDVDIIDLGTHGRSGVGHLLMGSVAETVIRHADCPVMTIRQPKEAKHRVAI
jgi:hypothetical protein